MHSSQPAGQQHGDAAATACSSSSACAEGATTQASSPPEQQQQRLDGEKQQGEPLQAAATGHDASSAAEASQPGPPRESLAQLVEAATARRAQQAGPVQPEEEESCRICLGTSTDNLQGEQEPLLDHPCACTGTVNRVHLSCLTTWAIESRSLKCEVCKTQYAEVRAALGWIASLGGRGKSAPHARHPAVCLTGTFNERPQQDGRGGGPSRCALLVDPACRCATALMPSSCACHPRHLAAAHADAPTGGAGPAPTQVQRACRGKLAHARRGADKGWGRNPPPAPHSGPPTP